MATTSNNKLNLKFTSYDNEEGYYFKPNKNIHSVVFDIDKVFYYQVIQSFFNDYDEIECYLSGKNSDNTETYIKIIKNHFENLLNTDFRNNELYKNEYEEYTKKYRENEFKQLCKEDELCFLQNMLENSVEEEMWVCDNEEDKMVKIIFEIPNLYKNENKDELREIIDKYIYESDYYHIYYEPYVIYRNFVCDKLKQQFEFFRERQNYPAFSDWDDILNEIVENHIEVNKKIVEETLNDKLSQFIPELIFDFL